MASVHYRATEPARRTVYLLGAGVNRLLLDQDGRSPPLAGDVFQVGLQSDRVKWWFDEPQNYDLREFLANEMDVPRRLLPNTRLSIEECFDRVTDARTEAQAAGDLRRLHRLGDVPPKLFQFLGFTMVDMFPPLLSPEMVRLAEIMHAEQADVITFNYDTLLETYLETSSGWPRDLKTPSEGNPSGEASGQASTPGAHPQKESHRHAWRPLDHYWVRFEQLEHRIPGPTREYSDSSFHDEPTNAFQKPKFLKLHGSTTWFRYSERPDEGSRARREQPDKALCGKLLHKESGWSLSGAPPSDRGWLLDPVVATGSDKAAVLTGEPFSGLWAKASEILSGCERLVICGFSFAPADKCAADLVANNLSKAAKIIWVDPSQTRADAAADRMKLHFPGETIKSVAAYVANHELSHIQNGFPMPPEVRQAWMEHALKQQ
jgi:hypothetical protein